MHLRRLAVPALAALLSACGARTSIDHWDAGGQIVGTGGAASGGASSGGSGGAGGSPSDGGAMATGGILTTGGTSSGGASTGGSSGICPQGYYQATPGPDPACEPWSICEPGSFVVADGTDRSNRECSPCPPRTYSDTSNATRCEYGGCRFDELVAEQGSATQPSVCVAGSDTALIDSRSGALGYFGASAGPTTAYIGLYGLEVTIRGYEGAVQVSELALPLVLTEFPTSFTAGPEGGAYVASTDYSAGTSHVTEWSPQAEEVWRISASNTDPYAQFGAAAYYLIQASDSHLLTWGGIQYNDAGEQLVPLGSMARDGSGGEIHRPPSPITFVSEVAVDDNEGFWMSGPTGDGAQLFRYDSVTSAPVLIPRYSNSFLTITGAPDGRGYAAWTDIGYLWIVEYAPNTDVLRVWTVSTEELGEVELISMATNPDKSIVIGGISRVFPNASASYIDAFVILLDPSSGAYEVRSLVGPGNDIIYNVVMTGSGSAYITGTTEFGPPPSNWAYFVRQVF